MSESFDYGKWKAKLLFEPGRYEFLHHYVSDDNALMEHAKNYQLTELSENGEAFVKEVSDVSEKFRRLIINNITEGVTEALDTLSRQMLVVSVSFIEGIIDEFFQCLFHKHPGRMHDFLSWNQESPKGWIPIKVLLESADKDKAIDALVRISCDTVTSGEIGKIIKRIERLGKTEICSDLKLKLAELFKVRNLIVHERYEPDLNKKHILYNFEIVEDLLRSLSVVLIENNVRVNDPTGYLEKAS